MKEVIMAKYGEIALKGLNKSTFEDILIRNIKRRLSPLGRFEYSRRQSTIYIEPEGERGLDEAADRLRTVFGIGAIQRCAVYEKDMDKIKAECPAYLRGTLENAATFKVEAKRSDKSFPLKTPEIQAELGDALSDAFPHLKVDVHRPDVTVYCEIRDNGAYVSAGKTAGAGGIPVGSSGRALLLLSGGIDSPVAAYMMAKRGLITDAVHFQSPPYTSGRALMKVQTLCEKLTAYCGDMKLYCVPFTEIQETLRDNCPQEYFTVIMRRLMIKIAVRAAETYDYGALITGESMGQVASQTLKAIQCTDAAADRPVLRPLIGMDKKEITDIARKIDTFDTSVLPYEDCCTVFTPKHPKTRPELQEVEKAESAFDYEPLINAAFEGITVYRFSQER